MPNTGKLVYLYVVNVFRENLHFFFFYMFVLNRYRKIELWQKPCLADFGLFYDFCIIQKH